MRNVSTRFNPMDPELTPGQRLCLLVGLGSVLFLLLMDAGAFN